MNQIVFYLLLMMQIVHCYERSFSSCNDYKLLNGKMKINKRKMAKFQCNKGYTLAGEKYNFCIRGKFDIPPPVCVRPTCQTVKQFSNGLIFLSYNGGVMNFYCKAGYTMRGNNISYCDGSRWSHNLPACISTHNPLATSCDFETEDLCGFSHDLNYNFEWRRQNLQTPSGHVGTGPKYDHTLGPNNTGYYMYVESSSRLENDTASLISPLYPPFPGGLCVSFWYHMFGKDMGTLHVYIRRAASNTRGFTSNTRGNLDLVWSQSGNQGDIWRQAYIDIPKGVEQDFQIIFDGIRGKSHISDLAIDDVELLDSCPVDDMSTSTTEMIDTDEPEFGSCVNRCYENSSEIILGDTSSCECNEGCYERNTCCPDYTIVCLMINFDDTTTDITDSTLSTDVYEEDMSIYTTDIEITTPEIKTTVLPTTTTRKIITTTPKITTTTPKITTTLPTPKKPTTKKLTTKYITTKILTTKSVPTTKLTTPSTTQKTTFTTPTSSLPTSTETMLPTLQIETDYILISTENTLKVQNEKIISPTNVSNSNNTLIYSVCGLVGLCAVVVGMLAVRYYRICHRLKLRNLRGSESMSDVRFLASDEVLDFTWRNSL